MGSSACSKVPLAKAARTDHSGGSGEVLFVAAVAVITTIAAMVAIYDGNDTMITNTPVSRVMASSG